ncbi:NADAR family protein [uncultured Clostridium sp.]|uniref:NADAR family protein n=1 Tax=uncultured Clostridium sp. TaxID=59620 RepID=UPI002637C836|nr:NADAR family protein [uncultured Clostridium sp.]
MKYNLEGIKEQYKNDKNMECILFWGHRVKENDVIRKSCFSQWYKVSFNIDGIIYNCAEQYMMAEKAKVFEDVDILLEILETSEQARIKILGRMVKNFDEEIWNNQKYKIVVKANLHKFSQNEELKEFLIGTGDKVIVEASLYDKVWGIGMNESDKDATNPNKWKGENLLGFALMEVRDLLLGK